MSVARSGRDGDGPRAIGSTLKPLAKRTAIGHGAFKGRENDSTVVTRDSRDQYFRLEPRNTFGAKSGGADDLTAEQRLGAVERSKLGTGLSCAETPEVNPKL